MSSLRYLLSITLSLRTFSIVNLLVVATLFTSLTFMISSGVLRYSDPPIEPAILKAPNQIISCAPATNFAYLGVETIAPNDNRQAAGELRVGVLTINLEVGEGVWYPETPANPGIAVYGGWDLISNTPQKVTKRNPGPLAQQVLPPAHCGLTLV